MRWDIEGFSSWTASDGFGRGSYGVAGERGRATAHLAAAVGGLAPGTVGVIRWVRLDRYARQPSYIHGRVILRVHRDVDTGAITIERGDA